MSGSPIVIPEFSPETRKRFEDAIRQRIEAEELLMRDLASIGLSQTVTVVTEPGVLVGETNA